MQQRSSMTPSYWQLLQMIRLKILSTKFPRRRCASCCHHRRNRPFWRISKSKWTCHCSSFLMTLSWIWNTSSLQTRCEGRDAHHWCWHQEVDQDQSGFDCQISDTTIPPCRCILQLEPQRSLGQGADLSILTAIKYASIRPNFLSALRGDFLGVFLPNEDLLTVSSIVVR